ncbi:MAG: heavy-metal-associated domain-containing protein [Kiritimatiellae bacterium]|nr:heavy-metal-associated domain-containing protein [Kiritimatiellia bacterium]
MNRKKREEEYLMWKMLLPIMLLIVCLTGCRKQDMRTVVVTVPGLKNQACAQIIQDAFMRQPGIKTIRPDWQQHTLTVTYDSMVIARKNIEFTIAGAGFDANDIRAPTNAVAALPAACK